MQMSDLVVPGVLPPPAGAEVSYRVDELVHQSLGHVGLADDALFVVLPDGAAQLVVVHGGSVLSEAPQPRHVGRVLDFKNTCRETQVRGFQSKWRGKKNGDKVNIYNFYLKK